MAEKSTSSGLVKRSPDAVQPFLTDVELAERWNMSPKTLRNARVAGGHVPFVRIGRLVRYSVQAVLEYEQRHTMSSTSQPTKPTE